MRTPVSPDSPGRKIVDEERELLARVCELLAARSGAPAQTRPGLSAGAWDAELIALRDQLAEEKAEDIPTIVEHMTRVQALAAGARPRAALPIDPDSPYFAHLRLADERHAPRDILIGKRGMVDREARAAGVQIVDWRDAPVSQIYYRYDEGDDYDEALGGGTLRGVVLARRNVAIQRAQLRRIGCPQGTFVASGEGAWYALEGEGHALLEGGQGTAARAPQQEPRRRMEVARATRSTKQLPEIAALIDPHQFEAITAPDAGLVVIQGGAGSGKTTVALHRIAFLTFDGKSGGRLKPSRCLFVVPSDALGRYVAGVLPALGVHGVPVVTLRGWMETLRQRLVPSAPRRYSEDVPVAVTRLKKHPALLALVEEAISHELAAMRALLSERVADVAVAEREIILGWWDAELDPPKAEGAPLDALRRLRTRLGRAGERSGISPVARNRTEPALKLIVSRMKDVRRIVFELLTDRGRLAALKGRSADREDPISDSDIDALVRWCSEQLEEPLSVELEGIDEERVQAIDGRPLDEDTPDAGARGRIDREDDALLLRAYQLVHGCLHRVDGDPLVYDHIAVDEAQDLSAVEVKLLYAATNERRSMTIAGDVAQRVVFDNGFRGWQGLLEDIGVAEHLRRVRPLRLSYRSTAQVMRFARAVLGPLAAEQMEGHARSGAEVGVHAFDGMGEAVAFVAEALRSLLQREPLASVVLLSRHAAQADAWYNALVRAEVPHMRRVRRQEFPFEPGIDVTDASQVKGLEFDYVILLDVNASSYPASVDARHLLHIGATRATHQLWVISTGVPSPLLDEVRGGQGDGESAPADAAAQSAPASEAQR